MIVEDPYARLVRFRRNPFRSELAKISVFAPDLFVVALFQHSFFDEICLAKLPSDLKVAGFRCTDGFWSTQANTPPQEIAERFSIRAEVETLPESRKSLTASAILDPPVHDSPAEFRRPRSPRTRRSRSSEANGLEEQQYWVVCAGPDRA